MPNGKRHWTRGGRKYVSQNEESLQEGVQHDVQASLGMAPEGSPPLYDAQTTPNPLSPIHHEDWYEQMSSFYRTDIEVPAELIVDGRFTPKSVSISVALPHTLRSARRKNLSMLPLIMAKGWTTPLRLQNVESTQRTRGCLFPP